jgi:hypothetical protein
LTLLIKFKNEFGMGFGIWDIGWNFGYRIGMELWKWEWDKGVWGWNMTPMGIGNFPFPLIFTSFLFYITKIIIIFKNNKTILTYQLSV